MGYVEAEPYCSHAHKKNTAPLWEKPGFPVFRHAFSISQKGHCCTLLFWDDDMLKGWKHWINNPSHGGIAGVYRLFLPTGQRGLFHNVLLLSPYLELRERFPYLTHSCKLQLNSSNSENELRTRLLSIWFQGSSQGWSSLRDLLSLLIVSKDLSKPCSPLTHTFSLQDSWAWV